MNQVSESTLLTVLPPDVTVPASNGQNQSNQDAGYICPITGEELPCPKCCPLNGG